MSKTINITFNSGMSVGVPSVSDGTTIPYQKTLTGRWDGHQFPGYQPCNYYEEGVSSAIIWFSSRDHLTALGQKPNYRYQSDFTSAFSTLLNGVTEEVYNSDVYTALVNDFNNSVEFIYGSLTEGGLFIVKSADAGAQSSSDYYFMGLSYGIYKTANNIYYAKINTTSRYDVQSYLKMGLAIYNHRTWTETTLMDDYYKLSVYMAGNPVVWHYFADNWILGGSGHSGTPEYSTSGTSWGMYIDTDFSVINYPKFPFWWDGQTNNRRVDFGEYVTEDEHISGDGWGTDFYAEIGATDGGGISSTGGGGGVPSTDSDDIDGESADSLNQLTAINSGLVTLFNPTTSELASFAEFLYTGITDSIEKQLKKLISNPLEYVLFIALCKFQPPVSATREEIGFCGVGSGVYANKINLQFTELNCGSIAINEQFASFLDYAPHSKIKIYLPFCGVHDILIDDCMGGTINVNYLIDMLSGSCVARVKVTRSSRFKSDSRINSVLYEFNGNCYLTAPLSSSDWRGTYSSIVNFVGGVVQGMSGNTMGAVGSIASSITSQKMSVARSGQAGSNYGYMGNKKPYLILERPIQSVPANYGGFIGYTSNIRDRVSNLRGYTEIDDDTIWTDFGKATEEECQMIKDIMNKGVYL